MKILKIGPEAKGQRLDQWLAQKQPKLSRSAWQKKINLYFPQDEIHYETELVFKINSGGFQMTPDMAKASLGWYTVGLDMTKRILQKQLKDNGHPWTLGKVFPDAAIVGPWISLTNLNECLGQVFSFSLNGESKQKSTGSKMIFNPIDLIVYASQFFPLEAGDILFTGTPSGVGKVVKGDIAEIAIGDKKYCVEW